MNHLVRVASALVLSSAVAASLALAVDFMYKCSILNGNVSR